MGIDAVVVLKIAKLQAPATEYGTTYLVEHRGDCSLLHMMMRFHGTADEHGLMVRQLLGSALDAHDDARGMLVFADVYEPRAKSYAQLTADLADGAVWAPKVAADQVPDRITRAAPGRFEDLVRRALEAHAPRAAKRSS